MNDRMLTCDDNSDGIGSDENVGACNGNAFDAYDGSVVFNGDV